MIGIGWFFIGFFTGMLVMSLLMLKFIRKGTRT